MVLQSKTKCEWKKYLWDLKVVLGMFHKFLYSNMQLCNVFLVWRDYCLSCPKLHYKIVDTLWERIRPSCSFIQDPESITRRIQWLSPLKTSFKISSINIQELCHLSCGSCTWICCGQGVDNVLGHDEFLFSDASAMVTQATIKVLDNFLTRFISWRKIGTDNFKRECPTIFSRTWWQMTLLSSFRWSKIKTAMSVDSDAIFLWNWWVLPLLTVVDVIVFTLCKEEDCIWARLAKSVALSNEAFTLFWCCQFLAYWRL